MNNNYFLKDKVVLINGGSRGIGAGLVRAFSKAGSIVYFTYNKSEGKATALVRDCIENGGMVYARHADSVSNETVAEIVKEIWNERKSIDILVNNAAIVPRGLFLNTPPELWSKTMECNINGVYNYCYSTIKYMILKKQGVIINISSVSGQRPALGQAAYSTSKGAIESLTKVLALEYGPYNIRVNAIAPGLTETEIYNPLLPTIKDSILNQTPLKRFACIEDITNTALFLASDDASYLTGIVLFVTGGRHLL